MENERDELPRLGNTIQIPNIFFSESKFVISSDLKNEILRTYERFESEGKNSPNFLFLVSMLWSKGRWIEIELFAIETLAEQKYERRTFPEWPHSTFDAFKNK